MWGFRDQAIVEIGGRLFSVPIKNTFIHSDLADRKHKPDRRSRSLPAMQSEWSAQPQAVCDSNMLAAELPGNDGQPSRGSVLHDGKGSCKPCAWNWKPSGCSNGASCGFCHTCDVDQIKRRKQHRIAELKSEKQLEMLLLQQTLNLRGAKGDLFNKSNKSIKKSSDGRLAPEDKFESSSHESSSGRKKTRKLCKGAWKNFLTHEGNNLQSSGELLGKSTPLEQEQDVR